MLIPSRRACPPCPPSCLMCGGDPLQQSEYCDAVARRASAYSPYSPRQQEKTRESLREEAAASMEAAYTAGASSIAQNVGSTAEPKATPRKRKRRSKEEMAEVRADAADLQRRIRRRVTPDWLQGQDEDEDAFVASLREEA